jgi:peptidylprolyl isomerase
MTCAHPCRLGTAILTALLPLLALSVAAAEDPAAAPPPQTTAEVLAASKSSDWRPVDPAHTLYLELPSGKVILELAPWLAPRHVENIEKLVAQRYFDGIPVVRSQDDYVVQWGDPAEKPEARRSLGDAAASLPPELDAPLAAASPFTLLQDGDVYAPEVGFSHELPVGRDPARGRAWGAHCYGMVGVGRGEDPTSGNGSELYVVIGHAPRHLDRNVTLVGRVVQGMEHLSTLPRGTGPLGFYQDPARYLPIRSVRRALDLPAAERVSLEELRTDTATFQDLMAARRTRRESWFVDPVGRVGLCNVPLPVRPRSAPGDAAE